MTPQDWGDLARVFTAGATALKINNGDDITRWALEAQAAKCQEIADERRAREERDAKLGIRLPGDENGA
jgi:hypothetical protein